MDFNKQDLLLIRPQTRLRSLLCVRCRSDVTATGFHAWICSCTAALLSVASSGAMEDSTASVLQGAGYLCPTARRNPGGGRGMEGQAAWSVFIDLDASCPACTEAALNFVTDKFSFV